MCNRSSESEESAILEENRQLLQLLAKYIVEENNPGNLSHETLSRIHPALLPHFYLSSINWKSDSWTQGDSILVNLIAVLKWDSPSSVKILFFSCIFSLGSWVSTLVNLNPFWAEIHQALSITFSSERMCTEKVTRIAVLCRLIITATLLSKTLTNGYKCIFSRSISKSNCHCCYRMCMW